MLKVRQKYMRKSGFIKSLEQDLIYIIVLLMAITTDFFITQNYFGSVIWQADAVFLFLQSIIFLSNCFTYLKYRNNADTQEDADLTDDYLKYEYETGQRKALFLIKSIITKSFVVIIVIRVVLHLLGIKNI